MLSQHCAMPDQGGFCYPGHSSALTQLYQLDPSGTSLSDWASLGCSLSSIWSFMFYNKSKGETSSLKEEFQSLPWSCLPPLIFVLLTMALPSFCFGH